MAASARDDVVSEVCRSSSSCEAPRLNIVQWNSSATGTLYANGALVSDPPEPDDELHRPDKFDGSYGRGNIFSARGISNLGFMLILTGGLVFLFAGLLYLCCANRG